MGQVSAGVADWIDEYATPAHMYVEVLVDGAYRSLAGLNKETRDGEVVHVSLTDFGVYNEVEDDPSTWNLSLLAINGNKLRWTLENGRMPAALAGKVFTGDNPPDDLSEEVLTLWEDRIVELGTVVPFTVLASYDWEKRIPGSPMPRVVEDIQAAIADTNISPYDVRVVVLELEN